MTRTKKLPRFLVPALFLGTAALAATFWIVPIPFAVPGQSAAAPAQGNLLMTARQGGASQGPVSKPSTWSRPETPPWTDLTEKLIAIRPEAPDTAIVGNPEAGPTEQPDRELDWTYMGSIIHDALRVAQVRIGEDPRQHFFFEGDVIPDPTEADEEGIKIISVTEQILTVHWMDQDHELRLGESGSDIAVVAAPDPAPVVPPKAARDPSAERSRSMRGAEQPDPAVNHSTRTPVPPRRDERRFKPKSGNSAADTSPASAERPS